MFIKLVALLITLILTSVGASLSISSRNSYKTTEIDNALSLGKKVQNNIRNSGEQARSADSFVDSIGVGTHWSYPNTPYGSRYAEVRDKLVALGVRHVRDGGASNDTINKMRELAGLGIKTTFVMDPNTGTKPNNNYWSNSPNYRINEFVKAVGTNVIDSVEVLNEIDLFYKNYYWKPTDTAKVNNDPNSSLYWGKYIKAITQDTWTALKNDPATAGVKVLGPSMTTGQAYSSVGDLTPYIDASTAHYYLAGRHPGTSGWGDNGYGSLDWTINTLSRKQSPSKPTVFTEGGYSNAVNGGVGNAPEVVTGKYIPRAYFRDFNKGVQRAFMYEFVDEWPNPAKDNSEANFGLLRNDLSEKPAYTALKNLISVLKDPGSSFTPGKLNYTLSGTTSNVDHTLLQKRDGTFYLPLWTELPSFDPNTKVVRTLPSQPVTLTLPSSIKTATVYSLSDKGTMSSSTNLINGGKISLNVSDKVMVVKLLPVRL